MQMQTILDKNPICSANISNEKDWFIKFNFASNAFVFVSLKLRFFLLKTLRKYDPFKFNIILIFSRRSERETGWIKQDYNFEAKVLTLTVKQTYKPRFKLPRELTILMSSSFYFVISFVFWSPCFVLFEL